MDLKEVFKYPLGSFPWALAGSVGDLKKTNKAALLHELEKKLDPVEPLQSDCINVIDGMAFVKKLKVKSNVTFKEMSEKLLDEILKTSRNASQIHVVFDVYKTDSIKNAERIRRSSWQLQFHTIVASQKIKQWNQFLSSGDNKMQLIDFIVNQWQYDDRVKNTNPNIFYATAGTKCYNLSRVSMTEVSSLSTSQEEADTRMFLHVQYALNHLQGNIIINSPDTDVFIISLMVSEKINANINLKTSNKYKIRIINVSKIKESLKDKSDDVVSVGLECFTRGLVSLHVFTGCDTVSAFAGLGKSKAFKIMAKNVDYIKLFEKLGKDWYLEEEIMRYIEGFVCHLYGYSEMKDINMLQ